MDEVPHLVLRERDMSLPMPREHRNDNMLNGLLAESSDDMGVALLVGTLTAPNPCIQKRDKLTECQHHKTLKKKIQHSQTDQIGETTWPILKTPAMSSSEDLDGSDPS